MARLSTHCCFLSGYIPYLHWICFSFMCSVPEPKQLTELLGQCTLVSFYRVGPVRLPRFEVAGYLLAPPRTVRQPAGQGRRSSIAAFALCFEPPAARSSCASGKSVDRHF